ncbi:UDP-2,4-diacetamido-2,4,6-trideoxy-beta-L-altropyranose hydrolase [Natronobacillus azotifigens]|uniref:UDP-2,4-diacetamido-2,4, 6-trideoxy-beta-L-altropyranose hydrolase n=1 Tax=Natronobacillus azotifigens TaxID=472978 RepID=A0A9J6R9Y2_9BACI|nr:UDP-2,4-diacetamido-2,4,6-trideoxy-beta-L-altropyranose hydrolase [Natronobacillus azotifigens]MCZ0702100.1 UDP-2,4-diacetamido-2,4,6-trideoxy-beta-L-altropyranose hydrolase [Natronobacillus azotifigens]
MQIFFRVDASNQIGSGHVQRCLTLAEQLKQKGAEIHFIINKQKGNMEAEIRRQYSVYFIECMISQGQELDAEQTVSVLREINRKVDLLIVDHHQLSVQWQNKVKPLVEKLMVIDDLANRKHNCDLLLDQNYYKDYRSRYKDLVPASCRQLLGPKYLLLRPEFNNVNRNLRKNESIERLLICYGGADPTNETEKVLTALKKYSMVDKFIIDVVVGSNYINVARIKQLCSEINANLHYNINYMATLIAKADLAFGAGGVSMWERCYLGLPSVVTIVADNQSRAVNDATDKPFVINLGWHHNVNVQDYYELINRLTVNLDDLKKIREKLVHFINQIDQHKCVVAEEIIALIS